MSILRPNLFVNHYSELTLSFLKENQFTLLVCDIDNTLVAHDEALPSEEARLYIQNLVDNGIKVIFISNNYEQRVKTFADVFPLPYIAFAKKPMQKAYKIVKKNYPHDKVICLGDQILTDVFGGNRAKFFTVKTRPLVERDLNSTKINRKLERLLSKFWEEKK